MASASRQGTGISKDFVPHPASEELLKKSQELLQLVMAHHICFKTST
jgi:hypothetical protein